MSNLTHSYGHGQGTGNETLLANPQLCTLQTCDLSMANFLYLPSVGGNALYAIIFGVSLLVQLFLGIKHKTWGYMVAMIFGLALEIIGYAARITLHNSPFDNNSFLEYLVCATIAPAFLTAAIYLCLGRIVHVYGEHLSYFKPGTYTLIFCTCDLISLVLQALGGAIASGANTQSQSDLGRNIMLAGLIFQVVSLIIFAGAAGDFARRVWGNKSRWNVKYIDLVNSRLFKSFLTGLLIATVTIFVRCVYRVAELSGGFNSALFTSDQALFMVLEGAMVSIAVICLTLLHPGLAFQGTWHEANFKFRKAKGGNMNMSGKNDIESGSGIEMHSQAQFVQN